MLEIFSWIILFVVGYLVIFFSADVFIDNLKEACLIYNVSPFIIGSLILGIDPEESIASIIASINGLSRIAVGNVIGNSIIALTISFAIPAFFFKISFKSVPQFYFTLLYACMVLILVGFVFSFGFFIVGIIAILLYFVYLNRSLKQISSEKTENVNSNNEEIDDDSDVKELKIRKIALIVISFIFIFLGGELLIFSAEQIMIQTNIPEAFFGLVIIAFVTNVEELTLVVKSIKKQSVEMGMGGMIGKVIWNLAITFGVSAIIIVNMDFMWIFFWNWLVLFLLIIYFNWLSKKEIITWKDGIFLTFFLIIFIGINFLTIF